MKRFLINGYLWKVVEVSPYNPSLIDRTGNWTVATTDPITLTISLSSELQGNFKKRVIAHELGHATCFSYGLLSDIHRCCYPWKRVEMEEIICNIIADYGEEIFLITYNILGDDALYYVPKALQRIVA